MTIEFRMPASPVQADAQRRPFFTWGVVLALLLAVAMFDTLTGFEVSVFLLYTVPVAVGTHRLGTWAGVCVSLLATVAWVVADVGSGHTYSADWILPVNALNRCACFLLAVAAIRYLNQRHAGLEARLQAFTGELLTCTACDKVQGPDQHWRSAAAHITEFGGARLLPKVCPDCARRAYAHGEHPAKTEGDITPTGAA